MSGIKLNEKSGSFLLPNGFEAAASGLGTYSLHGRKCIEAVKTAIELGCRYIDTASFYSNEAEVGTGVKAAAVPRSEVLVATKIYPNEYSYAARAIEDCLDRLQLDYVDVMLLHHPAHNDVQAWRAIERAIKAGRVRFGGISCYYIAEIDRFLPQTEIKPILVQNELHPFYQDSKATQYLQSLGLLVQAWYPLGGRGYTVKLLGDPVITKIAAAHGRSAAQIILRWNVQRGVAVIPGSADPLHLKQNLELFDFALSDSEMQAMAALERAEKHDWY